MVAKRLNLCCAVRTALINSGYSTVKVVDAVNAALNDLQEVDSEAKLGNGSITKATKERPALYKVSETVTTKYRGPISVPLIFDRWHSAIRAAEKIAPFGCVDLPEEFTPWLEKMKEPSKPEPAKTPA